jgi:hypothetical protein
MASYNALVDLNGSRHLDGKTLLCLIDGLYGGRSMGAVPERWKMPPFHTNWPASLFASQDLVAIDSVALDFLRTEWGLMPNADNFLHEAALADHPPSGVAYAPNGDGIPLASLGVHEHWNNAFDKQYSRNLGATNGLELIAAHLPPVVRLRQPVANGGLFTAQVQGELSGHCTLQVSTNLTNWDSLLTNSSPTAPFHFNDSNAAQFPQRFYRVRMDQ